MTVLKNKFLLGGAAVLIAAALWIVFAPNEERRVRKTFDRVSALMAKDGAEDEHVLTSAGKANGMGELVATSLKLEAPELGMRETFDSDAVAQTVALMRSHVHHVAVTFSDLTIEFPKDATAEVLGNVKVDADERNFGFKDSEARTFEATLKKDDDTGTWKFSRVKVHRVN